MDIKPAEALQAWRCCVTAYDKLIRTESSRLEALLRQSSDLLQHLSDPLELPFRQNRWLDPTRQREESYSDWLAWLLEQMDSGKHVLKAFGLDGSQFDALVRDERPEILREKAFTAANGERKRLDLVVRFGTVGILLVEIKINTLEKAGGEENLPTYYDWLASQPEPSRCAILLAPGSVESPHENWRVLHWEPLCLNLRRQARELAQAPDRRLLAAMLLCFAGAVEQNILGLDKRPDTFSAPKTAQYLARFTEGES